MQWVSNKIDGVPSKYNQNRKCSFTNTSLLIQAIR